MKSIKNNISIIIIVAIILLSTFFLGTPINDGNIQVVYIAISLFSIIYYIVNRESLIKDRMDKWIAILSFATLIPLIFRTYVSLSGTISAIIKYFCLLNMFLITKHECKKKPQYVHVILNTIIVSILILCIFGLDEIGNNYLETFKDKIGYYDIGLKDGRIGSLFSYANAMAAVAVAGIFLCLGYIFSDKKIRIKLIYIFISIVMFITMILTYSRLVYIVFAFMCIIYALILCKKYNIKEKISKKILLILASIVIVAIIYIIVGLQIPEKLNVKDEYQKKFYNIQADSDYNFSFDISATTNKKDNFIIEITQRDEYLDQIDITTIEFDTYTGNKNITVHTKEDTTAIYIKIKKQEVQGKLQINSLTLNGEDITLSYKFLPTKLVLKIQEISLGQKSVWQRFVFMQDAFKQIKDNWLFGLGGNAWRTVQSESQEYSYYAQEVHSFPIQIFLENGIVAFIACIAIIICILKILYKEIRKQELDIIKISSIIAILCIIVHSIFDFDMSFFYVLLIVFSIIATLENREEKRKRKNAVIQRIVSILLIIISIIVIYVSAVEKHFDERQKYFKVNKVWTEERIMDVYYKLIPFNEDVQLRRIRVLNNNKNSDTQKLQQALYNIIINEKYYNTNLELDNIYSYIECSLELKNNSDDYLQFALEYIQDTEEFSKFKPEFQIKRLNNIQSIIKILENKDKTEYIQKFKQQLAKEINDKENYILDYQKGRYDKEQVEKYRENLNILKKNVEGN